MRLQEAATRPAGSSGSVICRFGTVWRVVSVLGSVKASSMLSTAGLGTKVAPEGQPTTPATPGDLNAREAIGIPRAPTSGGVGAVN